MCPHRAIVVDYLHSHGDIIGVPVAELIARPSARPIMTLAKPRCADCGQAFTPRELEERIAPGGDLYSPGFVWGR